MENKADKNCACEEKESCCHSEHHKHTGCCCHCDEHEEGEKETFFSELAEEFEKPIYIIISLVALILNIVLSYFATGTLHSHDNNSLLNLQWYDYISFVAIVLSGYPIIYSGLLNLFRHRKIKSSLLITIAIFASIYIGELFTAGEVAFLMALGEYLEDKTVNKAKKGISRLMQMVPQDVAVIVGKDEIKKPISEVEVGEIIKIRPGETIALDGIVVQGSSAIDQSNITGESVPVDVQKGSNVYSGSINMHGTINIEVVNLANNSSIQRMIELVDMAGESKSDLENVADKWSAYLVPLALLVAILVYVFTKDVVRMVSVLVVFCPCAFALATPTCIVAAIGNASKRGVLIKNKNAMENLAKSKLMAFDKTGTLTTGKLNVSEIIPLADLSQDEIMQIASSLEYHSEHPLAKAIQNYAKENEIKLLDVDNFRAITGWGVEGSIDGVNYSISRANHEKASELSKLGKATMMLNRGDEVLAVIALSDDIKANAPETISKLLEHGVESILLSGDNAMACKHIAEKLNIKHYKSDLMPEHKLQSIAELKKIHVVTMVGDGMNDAPALKSADVSVSMANSGSDVSVEASDIVLLGDDIGKLPYIKKLSKVTLDSIKLNLSVAMGINLVAVVLSICGLLSPVLGALVHNLGSVFVTLNAARLYGRKIDV